MGGSGASSSPAGRGGRRAVRSASIRSSRAARCSSSSRADSTTAKGSSNPASAGPRQSASASRGRSPLRNRSKRTRSSASGRSPASIRRTRYQHAARKQLAQLRDVHVHHLHRAGRRVLAPEVLDQPIDRDPPVRVEQQARRSARCARPPSGTGTPAARPPGGRAAGRTRPQAASGSLRPTAMRYSACISRLPSVASLRRSAISWIAARHSSQRPSADRRSRAFRVGP